MVWYKMITDTLITDDIWAEAPENTEEAFLFIALAAYKRLQTLSLDETARGPHDYTSWRRQYIYELSSIAGELGLGGLPNVDVAVQNTSNMNDFDAHLARMITRIKTSRRELFRADTVALSFQTKDDIRHHLEELRGKINASNLSEEARSALHRKVDAVEAELDKRRSSLPPFWILAGMLSFATNGVGILADLPAAVETVSEMMSALRADKLKEEQEQCRMTQPPQLEHQPQLQIAHQADGGAVA